MKLRGTNIPEQILRSRKRRISEEALLKLVHEIFEQETRSDSRVIKAIENGGDNNSNSFDIDLLETDRIFHISDIEKTCTEYRLRFLNSALFKGEIPYEAVSRTRQLEKDHQIELQGFKIMAPASAFKLENADDPLLFAPIGNHYYYLIHSWGKDLHPLRKILMWPFRHLETFIAFLFLLSLLLAFTIPDGMFGHNQTTTEFFIIFFFMFKWVIGLSIFYGFKFGKNFSSAIWDSKYFNA